MTLQVRALELYNRMLFTLLDPTFLKTFLMTYKSFTNLDELFDHLVRRFFISPPDGLSPTEAEEWRKLKQHIIQMRYVVVRYFALC